MVDTIILAELAVGAGGAIFAAGRYIEKFTRSAGNTKANREDITELDERIDDVEEKIDTVDGKASRIESKVDGLRDEMSDDHGILFDAFDSYRRQGFRGSGDGRGDTGGDDG